MLDAATKKRSKAPVLVSGKHTGTQRRPSVLAGRPNF